MTIALASAVGWFVLGATIGWLQSGPTTIRWRRWCALTAAAAAGLTGGALVPLIGVTTDSPLWTLSMITAMAGALTATLATPSSPETLSEPIRPLSTQE